MIICSSSLHTCSMVWNWACCGGGGDNVHCPCTHFDGTELGWLLGSGCSRSLSLHTCLMVWNWACYGWGGLWWRHLGLCLQVVLAGNNSDRLWMLFWYVIVFRVSVRVAKPYLNEPMILKYFGAAWKTFCRKQIFLDCFDVRYVATMSWMFELNRWRHHLVEIAGRKIPLTLRSFHGVHLGSRIL